MPIFSSPCTGLYRASRSAIHRQLVVSRCFSFQRSRLHLRVRSLRYVTTFVVPLCFNAPLDFVHPAFIRLKVGRTNDMVRRHGEHQRRCPLLRPTLVGYFPSGGETAQALAAGRIHPTGRTNSSHLLERVVHSELTDVAIHAPYLSSNGLTGGLSLGMVQTRSPCPSCE